MGVKLGDRVTKLFNFDLFSVRTNTLSSHELQKHAHYCVRNLTRAPHKNRDTFVTLYWLNGLLQGRELSDGGGAEPSLHHCNTKV